MTAATCELCSTPARFTITAAYPAEQFRDHPTFATYPRPMYRVCGRHLGEAMEADLTAAEANVRINPADGKRVCRTCARENTRRYRQRMMTMMGDDDE